MWSTGLSGRGSQIDQYTANTAEVEQLWFESLRGPVPGREVKRSHDEWKETRSCSASDFELHDIGLLRLARCDAYYSSMHVYAENVALERSDCGRVTTVDLQVCMVPWLPFYSSEFFTPVITWDQNCKMFVFHHLQQSTCLFGVFRSSQRCRKWNDALPNRWCDTLTSTAPPWVKLSWRNWCFARRVQWKQTGVSTWYTNNFLWSEASAMP